MDLLAIFTTTDSPDEARRIAQALVQRQLAACVQIEAIESVYRWDGAVQQSPEWRLLIKAPAERYAAVEAAIRELHSYTLPAIYAVPVAAAFGPYADWVRQNADGAPP